VGARERVASAGGGGGAPTSVGGSDGPPADALGGGRMVAALRVEIRQAPSAHSVQVRQASALHSAHSMQDGGLEAVALSSSGNSPLCAQLRRMDLHLFFVEFGHGSVYLHLFLLNLVTNLCFFGMFNLESVSLVNNQN
jgi:hypothetical protein